MKRTLRIDIEILDPTEPEETRPSVERMTDAVADYVARMWNANVSASVVYDSDDDPNYQKLWNEGTPIRVVDEDGSVSWEGRTDVDNSDI